MNNNVMMKSLALFCALSLLISALPAYAAQGAGMEAFVRAVHEQVLRNWPHMDKAWPGLNYNQHPFILFYVDDELLVNEAWLLNTQGVRKLDEKEYQGIAVPQPDGYSELRFDGKPGLAMSVDDYSLSQPRAQEETYRTATHEMVHFYYQPPQGEMAGSRAQVYPLDAQPRLYRAMIYQHLIAAFENPAQRDEHLGKARYWLNLWGKGYKKERAQITSTDIAEGTAKYIENLSTLLGENLTEEAKKARASQSIMREELFTSADMESYELGYVAGLLLDEVKPGWKQGFYETRLTLVDLLLMDVQPKDDQMNPDTERLVREEVEQVNREAGEQLSDMLRAREDKRVPYLRVDIGTVASSYEANGNYLVGEDDITTGYGSQYRAGEGSITIRKSSVILNFTEAGDAFLYLPLTMAHEVKDSVMMIDSENVQIKNVRVGTETMDGRTVYTVTAKDM